MVFLIGTSLVYTIPGASDKQSMSSVYEIDKNVMASVL